MRRRRWSVLSGATGLLGRYLLRDLLLAGHDLAVLVRPRGTEDASDRVKQLVEFWSDRLARRLPRPVVLQGDVGLRGLGLNVTDRHWLRSHGTAVVHAAAHVGFHATPDGEPCRSNLDGARHLLEECRGTNLILHHISTAFVCGRRTGTIREDELEHAAGFHNDYERSKYEAERLLRGQGHTPVAFYRPSIIVGDSRTGYTSTYHGVYRFFEFADRLARTVGPGLRVLPLRLPLTGDEPHDLVPVDWVAAAITALVRRPVRHGATYHLTADRPATVGELKTAAEQTLGLNGVSLVGPGRPSDPTALEEHFLSCVDDYWPYRDGGPRFDLTGTRLALPSLPPPTLDCAALARMIRFAVADRWGRRKPPPRAETIDCARYVEHHFPEAMRRSFLSALRLDLTVGLDVTGPEGGRWTCRWVAGELVEMCREAKPAEVVFRMSPETLAEVVAGRLTVQEAFLEERIDIGGDVEKGLKLGVLFAHLVRERPYEVELSAGEVGLDPTVSA